MSLLATARQEIRSRYPSDLDRDELRFTRYGLLNAALESMQSPDSIVSADVRQKALTSNGTTQKITVMKQGDLTVKNVRSCTIADYESDSALVTVVWTTYLVEISMVPSQYEFNDIAFQDDLRKKLALAGNTLAKAIETSIDAKLDANKSTVYNSSLCGVGKKYELTGDAINVPLAKQEFFFNDVDVIMNQDDFYNDSMVVVASTELKSTVRHYLNQGSGNDTNSAYQFGPFTYRFSNHVTNAANATGYIFTPGSLGILTRVDIDSQKRSKSNDAEWFVDTLPGLGPIQVGVLEKRICSDQSGINATLAATLKVNWAFSLDVALITPYNSDDTTQAGVIKKFVFAAA